MKAIVRSAVLGAIGVWLSVGSPTSARADEACYATYQRDFAKCRDARRDCIKRICPKDPEVLCPDGSSFDCPTKKGAVYGCRGKAGCTNSIKTCTEKVRGNLALCMRAAADREAQRIQSQQRTVPPSGRGFFDYLTKVIQMLRDQKVAFTAEVRRRIANAFSAIFKGQAAFMDAFKLLNPAEILKMEEQKVYRN